jgi:hypothetical protein
MTKFSSTFCYVFAVLLAIGAGPSVAEIVPDSGILNFRVMRSGTPIGTHKLLFRQSGDVVDVRINTRIAVKMAYITVYRFEHDGHEVWKNGRLTSMETRTHDDGTDHDLRVLSREDGKLRVIGDGVESVAEGDAVPASVWNPAFIRTGKLMNSLVGGQLAVRVDFRGEETLQVRGKPVKAKHYSMTGNFARELWYDEKWVLVRMSLTGKDGSAVDYILY